MDQQYLADCPICQKLAAGEVEDAGTHCSLITLGKLRVAALNTHQTDASPAALAEAFRLLKYQQTDGYMSEYDDAPGHWAVRVVRTNGLPSGTSEGKV